MSSKTAITKKSDIKFTQATRSAARQCLEAGYVIGMGVEATLAMVAGIRDACGFEDADFGLFEDDFCRIVGRAFGFAVPLPGHAGLKGWALVDELERIALTENGPDRIWDTLAASVGDGQPSSADRRIVAIFRALRGGEALEEIETFKSPRPSLAKRIAAIEAERERPPEPLPSLADFALRPLPEEPARTEPRGQAKNEAPVRDPGKIALRLFAHLHKGYVLTFHHCFDGTDTPTRFVPARADFDREVAPRFVFDVHYDVRAKNYDGDHGWDLEHLGWIREVTTGFQPAYCLTEKGAAAALRLFGEPENPLHVFDERGLTELIALTGKLVSGEIDETEFLAAVGLEADVLESVLDHVRWGDAADELCGRIEGWLQRRENRTTMAM